MSPRRTGRPSPLLGLAPGGVCRAVRVAPHAGALLPHRFTLTCDRSPGPSAVSLCCTSVRSPRPGSRQHPALWSPDFPRHGDVAAPCRGHPADSPSPRRLRPAVGRSAVAEVLVHHRVEARRLQEDLQAGAVLVAGADDHRDRRRSSRTCSAGRRPAGSSVSCGLAPLSAAVVVVLPRFWPTVVLDSSVSFGATCASTSSCRTRSRPG